MNDIFMHRSAKDVIVNFIEKSTGNDKKGAKQKIAKSIGVFPSYLTLILRGERTLNLDQGILI